MAPNDEWRNRLLNPHPEEQFGIYMNQVVLEKVRLSSRIPADAQIWNDMHVSMIDNMMFSMADQIIFQFESTVFKEKLPPQSISKTVEFSKPVTTKMFQPRSPWQFWKRNHQCGKWIGWFVRLFPKPEFEEYVETRVVRFSEKVTVDLQHAVVYPKARAISSPSMGGVAIRWVETEWRK